MTAQTIPYETRALLAPVCVDAKPAWHGEFRLAGERHWHKARSAYGVILYMTDEAAYRGAAVQAANRLGHTAA